MLPPQRGASPLRPRRVVAPAAVVDGAAAADADADDDDRVVDVAVVDVAVVVVAADGAVTVAVDVALERSPGCSLDFVS
eukprot:7619596-Pyramimonas_sp.AAC.1